VKRGSCWAPFKDT